MRVVIGIPRNAEVGRRLIRQRVEHWKDSALRFLPGIYPVRGAVASINRRYFEGQEILFPAEAKGFNQLPALVEKLVGNYNEDLAGSIERVVKLLDEAGDRRRPSPLTIDLAGLNESARRLCQQI